MGPGRQLLAQVTALVPVDSIELVEVALEQHCPLDRQVAAAVGEPVGQAQAVVGGRLGRGEAGLLKRRGRDICGQDCPGADRGQARIDIDDAARERRRPARLSVQAQGADRARAEQRGDDEAVTGGLHADLGAQLVHAEAPPEIIKPPGLAVEIGGLPDPGDEEVVQVLALRREEGGIDGAVGRELFDVVRDQPLEEAARIFAGDGHEPPVSQHHIRPAGHLQTLRSQWVCSILRYHLYHLGNPARLDKARARRPVRRVTAARGGPAICNLAEGTYKFARCLSP